MITEYLVITDEIQLLRETSGSGLPSAHVYILHFDADINIVSFILTKGSTFVFTVENYSNN